MINSDESILMGLALGDDAAASGGLMGTASESNATTAPLNNGESWTGTAELNRYNDLIFMSKSDTAHDIYIEFSLDGTNWDSSLSFSAAASIVEFHRLVKGVRYVRARIENNSGSNQTYLRFGMSFGSYGPGTTPGTLNVGQDTDTLVTRPHDWALDMAQGRWSGYEAVRKFGYNGVVSTTEEDIWAGGGTYTGWLTAAAAVRIKAGGNSADDSGGSGAQQITVVGLDENFASATETITTNGATVSSATTTTFIRVFRAYVSQVGTYHGSNTGAITIETTGGAVVALIEAALGQSQLSMYTVPAGKTAYLREYSFDVDGGKPTTCRIYQYRNADDVSAPYAGSGKRIVENIPDVDGHMEDHLTDLISFPAKTDIWMSAIVSAGGVDSKVAGRFSVILVDD